METRQISISVDTFAHIWAARIPGENNEDQILSRILTAGHAEPTPQVSPAISDAAQKGLDELPPSIRWTELLIWALRKHGGRATLAELYKTTRRGRLALGFRITPQHDAAVRERLESHCRESKKFNGKELFCMPEGKGAGVWALTR